MQIKLYTICSSHQLGLEVEHYIVPFFAILHDKEILLVFMLLFQASYTEPIRVTIYKSDTASASQIQLIFLLQPNHRNDHSAKYLTLTITDNTYLKFLLMLLRHLVSFTINWRLHFKNSKEVTYKTLVRSTNLDKSWKCSVSKISCYNNH